jgi:hypothetical protein
VLTISTQQTARTRISLWVLFLYVGPQEAERHFVMPLAYAGHTLQRSLHL